MRRSELMVNKAETEADCRLRTRRRVGKACPTLQVITIDRILFYSPLLCSDLRCGLRIIVQHRGEPLLCFLRAPPLADRKSTRLNSSHVKISYAVFCLKKKK